MENRRGRGSANWALCLAFLLGPLSILRASEVSGLQHEVGGTPGWSIPSRVNVSYSAWASNQTFKVGDTLYFSYNKEYHNVLEVTAAKYESCNTSDPIAQWDSGADVIPLNSSGTFYYVCGIPGHCQQGQKVAVEVVGGTRHQVGGNPGWTLPSMANVNYTTWASTQTFVVGDTLYFNYSKEYHNVLEVTAAKYNTCDSSGPIAKWDDGATTIPLNKTGSFYFICGIPGHCDAGQKVAVVVTSSAVPVPGSGIAEAPVPAPGPSMSSAYSYSMSPFSSLITLCLMIIMAFQIE